MTDSRAYCEPPLPETDRSVSRFGVVFGGVTDDICTVTVKGEVKYYKRIHVLEFDAGGLGAGMPILRRVLRGSLLLIYISPDTDQVLASCEMLHLC